MVHGDIQRTKGVAGGYRRRRVILGGVDTNVDVLMPLDWGGGTSRCGEVDVLSCLAELLRREGSARGCEEWFVCWTLVPVARVMALI